MCGWRHEWNRMSNYCRNCDHLGVEHDGDRNQCTYMVTDLYGTWPCLCPIFEADTDD